MNKLTGWLIGLMIGLSALHAAAQQEGRILIQGGTLHIGNGKILASGDILIERGRIARVAEKIVAEPGMSVVDAKGKQVYPGIILLNSVLGLNEIDAVRATRDFAETGDFNPNVRSLIAFNTDSKVVPTALFNGITYIQSIPLGGTISGSSSIVSCSGWNWEDAQLKADDGIHLFWPEGNAWEDANKQEERLSKMRTDISEWFRQAAQYGRRADQQKVDLRLKAMQGLMEGGTKRLYVHVSGAKGILEVLQFVKTFRIAKPVLVGAEEAYRVIPAIKQSGVPVVLSVIHRLPRYDQEDIQMPFKLPAMLQREGIKVAIGLFGSWESRNVMFNAGTAAAYGMTREEALACITGNAADITGVGDEVGTLEAGKRATLLISSGDVLDMMTNRMEHILVDGKEVKLENTQQELYHKFRKKYNLE